MTVLEIGGVLLVVGTIFYFLGILPKISSAAVFLGTCIVTGGLFGRLLTRGATVVDHLTNSLVGKVFGVAIPGLLVIGLLIFWLHDMHPKKGAKKRTFFIGIALAACLVAGLSSFQTLNQVPSSVRTGVSSTIG